PSPMPAAREVREDMVVPVQKPTGTTVRPIQLFNGVLFANCRGRGRASSRPEPAEASTTWGSLRRPVLLGLRAALDLRRRRLLLHGPAQLGDSSQFGAARPRQVVFVLDVADDLLDDVFQRDQADDLVVLVAD